MTGPRSLESSPLAVALQAKEGDSLPSVEIDEGKPGAHRALPPGQPVAAQ